MWGAWITCIRCGCRAQRARGRPVRSAMCLPCSREHGKEGWRAIVQVHAAVRKGLMPKASACICVDCAKPAHDYDHRDYTKPLEVAPVCRSCNQKRGPAFDSAYRARAG